MSLFRQIIRKIQQGRNLTISNLDYARKVGVEFGKGCVLSTRYWGSEPYLIEIGDHVHITSGVSFITHDGGVWVFREKVPDFDVFGKIVIGNNV